MTRRHIKRHAGPQRILVNAHCLFRFDEPVSPHLAADMAAEKDGVQVGRPLQFVTHAPLNFHSERRRTYRRCLRDVHSELHS